MLQKTRQSDSKFKDLGFILHQYPYTETSLILDVFTQNNGRLNLIAKGAKRNNSQLRPALQLFQPLWLSYSGKNELKTLAKAEPEGAILHIDPQYALYILYIHELIIQLCPKFAPHSSLFAAYLDLVHGISEVSIAQKKALQTQLFLFTQSCSHINNINNINNINTESENWGDLIEIKLRCFEFILLKECGMGLYLNDLAWVLDCPAEQNFIYLKNVGITKYQPLIHQNDVSPKISALTLWAILTEDFNSYRQHPDWANILQQSKKLNRYILSIILPYDLKTRAVLKSLNL